MVRAGSTTKRRLLLAAERRFADDGVNTARLSDIIRDAGQANDAAVHYHFGSRMGLLVAIVAEHVGSMDEGRTAPDPDCSDLELMRSLVAPPARLLDTRRGRRFLRIGAQLAAAYSERSDGELKMLDFVRGTVTHDQLAMLMDRVPGPDPEGRVTMLMLFVITSIGDRAWQIDHGRTPASGSDYFVEELSAMMAAAATAAVSQGGGGAGGVDDLTAMPPSAAAPR